jgi:ethanolamine ammonia-lyase small subunit
MSDAKGAEQVGQAALAESAGLAELAALPVMNASLAQRLRSLTAARVGLRRTGVSIETGDLLDFQLAHARARDAVHAPMQPGELLAGLRGLSTRGALLLHSAARDRATYLQRPDLGRKLDDGSRTKLTEAVRGESDEGPKISFVIADGLSSLAVERHALPLLETLLPALAHAPQSMSVAPVCVVEQGRVAVGDEIADALGADIVIVLIGERPGLSSPDSLGAYITWKPRPGKTTDAERNCISNIRSEGLSHAQAAARLMHYIHEARTRQLTGVALKDPDAEIEAGERTEMLEAESPIADASESST